MGLRKLFFFMKKLIVKEYEEDYVFIKVFDEFG